MSKSVDPNNPLEAAQTLFDQVKEELEQIRLTFERDALFRAAEEDGFRAMVAAFDPFLVYLMLDADEDAGEFTITVELCHKRHHQLEDASCKVSFAYILGQDTNAQIIAMSELHYTELEGDAQNAAIQKLLELHDGQLTSVHYRLLVQQIVNTVKRLKEATSADD